MNHAGRGTIVRPHWHVSSQQGCCGIGTISRLIATYTSPSTRNRAIRLWAASDNHTRVMKDMYSDNYGSWDMLPIIKRMQLYPYTSIDRNRTPYSWYGGALDADICYGAVLNSMKTNKYCMYFFSDNMTNEGDVHIGRFTTRGFVRWLTDNNAGSFQTSGPVTSLRTGSGIQGWIFTPHWTTCNILIKTQRERLVNVIKGLNSDIKISTTATEEGRENAIRREAFADSVTTGW